MAREDFVMLKNIWNFKQISSMTKICIFISIYKAFLLNQCETGRTTKTMLQKIQTFFNTCLRHIYNIRWPDKIQNENLWKQAGQQPLTEQILWRKWGWIGHILWKPEASTTHQALTRTCKARRKR
jgi:hypothetical protein